jgi:hypothetical protein
MKLLVLYFLLQILGVALAKNADCALIVPKDPLTATGLATPYRLIALNPADGPCHQSDADQATFVQSTIIDTDTGNLFVYNPLVIDNGTVPAAAPIVPKVIRIKKTSLNFKLPTNYVAGIWFGTNADTLTLKSEGNSLGTGNCVNGITGSIFGQFAYCNAVAFFRAANAAINANKIRIPPLGTAQDGFPCPTSRDFFIVDQDQSDNLPVSYLVTGKGKIAQNTAANIAAFPGSTTESNGSDEGLVVLVDNAFGCSPWTATDLSDPGKKIPSLALNELQAAARQSKPALVPAGDPMCTVDGKDNLQKLNAYRLGVNMNAVNSLSQVQIYGNEFFDIYRLIPLSTAVNLFSTLQLDF